MTGALRVVERCRVVVDNDWAGDPDGLVALAHHLLSPANRVVAVTSSQLNPWNSPPVVVTALDDASSTWTASAAGPGRAGRRVYTDVDVRLLVADLLARLRRHERRLGT